MSKLECMFDQCDNEPTDEVVISLNGLLLVYAVCPAHHAAMRRSALLAQPETNRGLIGLA